MEWRMKQIKTNLEKEREKSQEKEINGKPESPRKDFMEKYRKHSINDLIKNHDKNPHKIAL